MSNISDLPEIVGYCECISAELNDLIAFVIKEDKILILKNNVKLFFLTEDDRVDVLKSVKQLMVITESMHREASRVVTNFKCFDLELILQFVKGEQGSSCSDVDLSSEQDGLDEFILNSRPTTHEIEKYKKERNLFATNRELYRDDCLGEIYLLLNRIVDFNKKLQNKNIDTYVNQAYKLTNKINKILLRKYKKHDFCGKRKSSADADELILNVMLACGDKMDEIDYIGLVENDNTEAHHFYDSIKAFYEEEKAKLPFKVEG